MVAPLVVSIPHQLSHAEAKARVDKMMSELSGQVPGMAGFAQEWDGDRLSFETTVMGQTISGSADVTPQHVNLEILLPGMLGMMAGQIKSKLEQRGTILLGPPN
jgi:putative polyhydroxyalkanoate system protein